MKQLFRVIISISSLYFMNGSLYSQIDPSALRYNLVHGLPDIYISPMSERIGSTWRDGNIWEKHLIQSFYTLLAARNDHITVIDLGAQTGSFSLLAKYFPNSSWYAFEPIQEAADTLKNNLSINNIQNVSVFQMAVTDCRGKVKLTMPCMNAWGLSTLGSANLRFSPEIEREIDCIDLDSFIAVQEIKKVDFIKIDTEGSELSILRGARNMIMRDRPIILMEYNEENMRQCGVLKQDIDNFLTELKYSWQLISHEDILCTPLRF